MNNDYYKNEGFTVDYIKNPEYKWRCYISNNFWIGFQESEEPNTFHRYMQKLILGFKWVRVNEK